MKFFNHKVLKFVENLPSPKTDIEYANIYNSDSQLSHFERASEEQINKTLMRSPSKSCVLDPLPTWLLKRNMSSLFPIITAIVNKSFDESIVPDCFKAALLTPLIKKTVFGCQWIVKLSPNSQFAIRFVSKVLERVVTDRITSHMEENNLTDHSGPLIAKNYSA